MLFRTATDELIDVKMNNFKNDKIYYEKISQIKKQIIEKNNNSKLELESKIKLKKTFNNKNN